MQMIQSLMNQFWKGFNNKLTLTDDELNNELYENLFLIHPLAYFIDNNYQEFQCCNFLYYICSNEKYYNHSNFDKVLKSLLEALVFRYEVQKDNDIHSLKELLLNKTQYPHLQSPFLRLIETKNFQSAYEMLFLFKSIFQVMPEACNELAVEIKNIIRFDENTALESAIRSSSKKEILNLFQILKELVSMQVVTAEEFSHFIRVVESNYSIPLYHHFVLNVNKYELDNLLEIYKYLLSFDSNHKFWMYDLLMQHGIFEMSIEVYPMRLISFILFYAKSIYELGIIDKHEILAFMQKGLLDARLNPFYLFLEKANFKAMNDLIGMLRFIVSLDKSYYAIIKNKLLLSGEFGLLLFTNAINDSSFTKDQKIFILKQLHSSGFLKQSDLMYDASFYYSFFFEKHPENVLKLLLEKKYVQINKIIDSYQKKINLNPNNILFFEENLFKRDDNQELYLNKILDLANLEDYPSLFEILKKCYDLNIFTDQHIEVLLNRHLSAIHPIKYLFLDKSIKGSKFENYLQEIQYALSNGLSLFYNLDFLEYVYHDGKIQSRLLDEIILKAPENLKYYLNLLYTLLENNLISRATFVDLVMKHKEPGYSPLHELLYRREILSADDLNKYTKAVFDYLDFVEKMMNDGYISIHDCKEAILFENSNQYSTIHQAFNGFSYQVTCRYWSFCEIVLDHNTQFSLLKGSAGAKRIWCKEDKKHALEVNRFKKDLIRNLLNQSSPVSFSSTDEVYQNEMSPNSVVPMSLFSPNNIYNQNGLTNNSLFSMGMQYPPK